MATDPLVVLDTSALVALIFGEPGAELVRPVLQQARISAVNVAETMDVVSRRGRICDATTRMMLAAQIEPFDQAQAIAAGGLLSRYRRSNNLSLGDACCLALGMAVGAEVFTGDRNLATIPLPITLRLIR